MLVTRLKLPPFIVTLGTLSIFTAIALLYSGGQSVGASRCRPLLNWTGTGFPMARSDHHRRLHRDRYGVVVAFVLSQTSWGRHVYAVGDDIEAARLVGIQVNRVLLSVYTVAGLIFGITAWVRSGGLVAPARTRS